MTTNRRIWVQVAAIVFSLAGVKISLALLSKHFSPTSGPGWFEWGCSDQATTGGANCTAVLASPWSYWPPKVEGEPAGTGHVPVAFLGLVYFSVLAVWFFGVGRPSRDRWWVHLFPSVIVLGGLCGSVMFLVIMFTRLDAWCPWCVATHVLNYLIAGCLVILWPRWGAKVTPSPARITEPGETGSMMEGRSDSIVVRGSGSHPSFRGLGLTLMAIWLVLYGHNQLLGRVSQTQAAGGLMQLNNRYVAELERMKGLLYPVWQQTPPVEIRLRPDDPVRMWDLAGEGPPIIVFSDFECPKCGRFAKFLEEEVRPMFGGKVGIAFKHFPLHADCNPVTTTTMHGHACRTAELAEAARSVGGSDAFWKVHDFLFAQQSRLGEVTIEEISGLIGSDAESVRQAVGSKAVVDRIKADARMGRELGVQGTPTVFLVNRKVDELGTLHADFWRSVARAYLTGKIPGAHGGSTPSPDQGKPAPSAIEGSPGPSTETSPEPAPHP